MKLQSIIVFTIVLITYSECAQQAWLPSMFESLTNKTTDIKKYVREKGKNLKHFYTNKVQNNIGSYFLLHNVTNKTKSTLAPSTVAVESSHEKEKTFYDYEEEIRIRNLFSAGSPNKRRSNCADDSKLLMTTPQLIAAEGYPAEAHTIVTEDGYILTVHRIPYSKTSSNKESPHKTALLYHCLLGSSADWVMPGPEKGLAYILSEAGYDVWLANVRGNTYSRAHVSRTVDSAAFWNFTFHEVSQYDLPAVIDHIMNVKGLDVKINYIGHSMGTTVLFALLSTKVQYNKILRAGFALAPVAHMSDIRSPIRLLAKFTNDIEYLMKILGVNECLPESSVLRWMAKYACEINRFEEILCKNLLFMICGNDESQFNKTLMPLILAHVPAGTSTKTLVHYAQEVNNYGRFQQFDYGPAANMKYYGSFTPPEYPLHKITLPIALFSAQNDWLASDVDVTNLYVQLVNPIQHYIVPLKSFNHVDFLWAIDAPTLVYSKLLQLLEDGVSRPTAFFDLDLDSSNMYFEPIEGEIRMERKATI